MAEDFGKPQSRNEAILQNILGANNELLPPQSRIEALLQEIYAEGGVDAAEVLGAKFIVWANPNYDKTEVYKAIQEKWSELPTNSQFIISVAVYGGRYSGICDKVSEDFGSMILTSYVSPTMIEVINMGGVFSQKTVPENETLSVWTILNKQYISIVHSSESRARYNSYLILTQMGIVYLKIVDGAATAVNLAGYENTVLCSVLGMTVNIDLGYAWNVGVIIPILSDYVTSVTFG